jgi:ADP-ribose pyrophosphatase YjhB (NUDIX family)
MNNVRPISWTTVDMAIRWVTEDQKVVYLMGKKPGELGWRFPGGFKDRFDLSLEDTVLREAGEEVLKYDIDPKLAFGTPKYLSSQNVDDWRYEGETDGITTVFYLVDFIGTANDIKAGDDLAATAWFELANLKPADIETEHIGLYKRLLMYDN